jgi:hypothetical protein
MRSGFHAAHLAAERDLELLTVRSILYHTKLGLQLLHSIWMQSAERPSRWSLSTLVARHVVIRRNTEQRGGRFELSPPWDGLQAQERPQWTQFNARGDSSAIQAYWYTFFLNTLPSPNFRTIF